MKTQLVGHSKREGALREAKILNRVVRATEDGWEYECDQRHVEITLEQLGLTEAKPLSTPGVEETIGGNANSVGCGTKERRTGTGSAAKESTAATGAATNWAAPLACSAAYDRL